MLHLKSSLPLLQRLTLLTQKTTPVITPIIGELNPNNINITKFSTSSYSSANIYVHGTTHNQSNLVDNKKELIQKELIQEDFVPKRFNILYNLHMETCDTSETPFNQPTFQRKVRMIMHDVINKYYKQIASITVGGLSSYVIFDSGNDVIYPLFEASFIFCCSTLGITCLALLPKTTITLIALIAWVMTVIVLNKQYKTYKKNHTHYHCYKCFIKGSLIKCLTHT
jgi:hypothetical protein